MDIKIINHKLSHVFSIEINHIHLPSMYLSIISFVLNVRAIARKGDVYSKLVKCRKYIA